MDIRTNSIKQIITNTYERYFFYEIHDIEMLRRLKLMYLISFIAVIALVPVGIITFFKHNTVAGFAECALAAALFLNIVHATIYKKYQRNMYFGIFCVSLLFPYLILTGGPHQASFVWSYSIPFIAAFLLGSHGGVLVSLFTLVPTMILFIVPHPGSPFTNYNPDINLRFLVSYLILSVFAYLFEMAREKNEKALRDSEERYRLLFESTSDVIFSMDRNLQILSVSPSMESFLGYRRDDIMGKYAYDMQVLSPEHLERSLLNIKRIFEGATLSGSAEYEFIAKDGTQKYGDMKIAPMLRDGKIIGVTCVARDITERKRMEEEIRALAITDPLTCLYNRRGFLSLADQQIKIAERAKKGLLLIYIDLDGMKQINDSMGHKKGDEALVEVSRILKVVFRKSDIVARVGGDEFAILALGISMDHSRIIIDRLQQETERHNADEKEGYSISLSMGMVYYDPEHPISIDDLMSQADENMYAQKRNKKTARNTLQPQQNYDK